MHIITKTAHALAAVFNDYDAAERTAWWLIQKLTNQELLALRLQKEIVLTEEQEKLLDQWIYEMVYDQKPLAYILETVNFLGLTIAVEPPILIPRPETEEWCAAAIALLKKKIVRSILDMCTGSGCIALACARAFPHAQVTAADINPHAISLTQKNARALALTNITVIESDLFENLPVQRYDCILTNPPYISENEWSIVEPSVKKWEDARALIAADEGLALIKKIIIESVKRLNSGGSLWVEIGYAQGASVKKMFEDAGFKQVTVMRDLQGHDRMVHGVI